MYLKKIKKYFKKKDLIQFGEFYKIKPSNYIENNNSKLILVTSINPTPTGEGKTTTLIGINDCLNYFKKKSIAILRQPSMGPFFGIKGGATGSGKCSIENSNKINCGFTGDFFAIESVNNLIQSVIENEIYQNSILDIDESTIMWNRCIDSNDRSLRDINYKITNDTKKIKSKFNITAASYLMASFCLAKSKEDFKNIIENTLIAFSKKKKPIYIKDLNIINSIMMIIDDALNPNIAFSRYQNPIIIHGGPFANIAHGCNSVIATKLGLSTSDYVITESGFGIDLGAEKFLNIKTRILNKIPNLVVIAITIKSLKYHGGVKNDDLNKENIIALKKGFDNLEKNIDSIKSFNLNFVVVINKFNDDTNNEIIELKKLLDEKKYPSEISTMWQDGPSKNKQIHDLIMNNIFENKINYTYELNDKIFEKANKIAKIIYGANGVKFSKKAIDKINKNKKYITNYFVCFAKTFSSLSDDPKKINRPINFNITINDIEINHSAKFIILITSKVFLMPGLPKFPNAKRIEYEWKK